MKGILIVQTGSAVAPVRARLGDFPSWFQRGLRLPSSRLRVVQVHADEALPDPSHFAAAIVSGSGAMVTERLAWSENTAQWLFDAARGGLPILGVCYGHQLLAHAYGGLVEYNPRGREMGTVTIARLPAAANDPLLPPRPEFRAHVTHLQTVTRLPASAVVLARSALDDCQAVRYAPRVWGVQFHPEFDVAAMRGYVRARADALRQEDLDVEQMLREIGSCPASSGVLRRFLHAANIAG
jgi:GMP synthase (glutamine-hydrolysing)